MSEMNQEFENESVNPSEEPSKVPENPKNKTGKRVKYLVAGALGLVILSGLVKDSVYQIQEQEQALGFPRQCRKQDFISSCRWYRKSRR